MTDEEFRKKYPALWARHQKIEAKRHPPPIPVKKKGIKSPKTKPSRHLKPWTKTEVDFLEFYWGTKPIEDLCKHLDRSHPAVVGKAESLKLGSMNRGKMSLAALAEHTGYDRDRIHTAAKRALGKKLPRARSRYGTSRKTKCRHYAFDLHHIDSILEELAKHPDGKRLWVTHHHEWGGQFRNGDPKPKQCLECGRSDTNHHSKGRCRPCYDRQRTKAPRRIFRHVWKGRTPPYCKECGKTENPHNSKGLCRRCCQRQWRRNLVGLDHSNDPRTDRSGSAEGRRGSPTLREDRIAQAHDTAVDTDDRSVGRAEDV